MGPVYAYANAMRTGSVLFYSLQGVSIPAPHSPITFVRLRWKKNQRSNLNQVHAAFEKAIPLAEPRPRADHWHLLVLRGTPCKPEAVALL